MNPKTKAETNKEKDVNKKKSFSNKDYILLTYIKDNVRVSLLLSLTCFHDAIYPQFTVEKYLD